MFCLETVQLGTHSPPNIGADQAHSLMATAVPDSSAFPIITAHHTTKTAPEQLEERDKELKTSTWPRNSQL